MCRNISIDVHGDCKGDGNCRDEARKMAARQDGRDARLHDLDIGCISRPIILISTCFNASEVLYLGSLLLEKE